MDSKNNFVYDETFFDMFITINEDKTEAYLNIRPNSKINDEKLQEALQEAFKKVKLSINMSELSFGIVEDRTIIEHLKKYLTMPEEDRKKEIYSFLLAKGKLPVNGEDSRLIEYIDLELKKAGKVDEKTGKIDHKNLGFSDRIVPKDTKILTIVKPTPGSPGIAVTGEIIDPVPGELKHKIKFDKKTIYTKENDKEINFYAAKEGFLYKDSNKGYFVDEKVLVKSIDYHIGNIDGENVEDSSVEVHGSTDIMESAVKPGFKVEAKNINITGNIGVEAIVEGENIKVNGIADKGSMVKGKNINIKKVFNNILEGENIVIDNLNGSRVTGEKIYVKTSISGKLKGSEIVIINESRGSIITTDKFLFIKNMRGSSKQSIILDPFCVEKKKRLYENLKKEREEKVKFLEEIKIEMENLKSKQVRMEINIENIVSKYIKFDSSKKRQQMDAVKKLIATDQWSLLEKKFNIEFALHDIQKFELYKSYIKKSEKIKEKLILAKQELEDVSSKITTMETSVKNGKIIIGNYESDAPLSIFIEEKEYKLNVDVVGTLQISFSNLTPVIKSFDKKGISLLENILSEETYKIAKKLIK